MAVMDIAQIIYNIALVFGRMEMVEIGMVI
jgi:hypothetical protein